MDGNQFLSAKEIAELLEKESDDSDDDQNCSTSKNDENFDSAVDISNVDLHTLSSTSSNTSENESDVSSDDNDWVSPSIDSTVPKFRRVRFRYKRTETFRVPYMVHAIGTYTPTMYHVVYGFNDLRCPKYKSSSLPIPMPVVRFGFQEPCNDPQNFCYLYCMNPKIKNNPLYHLPSCMNFVHCKKRFDLDIDLERCVSAGRCITSSVVSNTPSNILRHVTINDEDPSKINLFVIVFETWECNSDINSCISIIIFDMNQWYKAQMPH
ncbi:hypothetical protein PGB90_009026 [Kerria lacca]